jgi:hypothetical protein
MARFRALFLFALGLASAITHATDYRLVVASDDPATRKAPSIAIFEPNGKLTKDDRITSITFSAGAEAKPNCLVSLDPASGKASLALGPDIEVYSGKVMIAGSKPTRKVIPGHLEIDVPVVGTSKDGKLSSVMTPIIQQVNNLPWVYIGAAIGIFMLIMFVMNRRSQQYTTSMSKEAKSLYLETVGRITERLDNIEAAQRNLVKNPPVARSFRDQMDDYTARLNRIEQAAKIGGEELALAAKEFSKSGDRYQNLTQKMDEAKAEAIKSRTDLRAELQGHHQELKSMLQKQDDLVENLSRIEGSHAAALESAMEEQKRLLTELEKSHRAQLEAAQQSYEAALAKHQAESAEGLKALQGEMATMRANQESLLAMPRELEAVSASLSAMPAEFESVRSSMPSLLGLEAKFDASSEKLDAANAKLDELPSKMPSYHEDFAQIHETILRQIEALTDHVDKKDGKFGEMLSAHALDIKESLAKEEPAGEPAAEVAPAKSGKKGKNRKEGSAEAEMILKQAGAEAEIELESSSHEMSMESEPQMDAPCADAPLEEVPNQEESIEPEAEVPSMEQVEEAGYEPAMPEVAADFEAIEEPKLELSAEAEMLEEIPAVEQEPEQEAPEEPMIEEAPVEPEIARRTEEEIPEYTFSNVSEVSYRYPDSQEDSAPFHFNNALKEMDLSAPELDESKDEEKLLKTFHLESLPDHLETFEDEDAGPVLQSLKLEKSNPTDEVEERKAIEAALNQIEAIKPEEELSQFDGEPESEEESAHCGHWHGLGGGAGRHWSSESSRPLQIPPFEGELKPLTPIETATPGVEIGAMAYGFGRVLYTCGSSVHSYWPGREDRAFSLDSEIPSDEWRLAVRGQNLYVAEKSKVRVVSLQGWYALEQFHGEYQDQLMTESRWVGLRDVEGKAELDFRDFRGAMAKEGVRLDSEASDVRLCAFDMKVYAGLGNGQVIEVSEFGTEEIGGGDGNLSHLTIWNGAPLGIYCSESGIEIKSFGDSPKSLSIPDLKSATKPVIMGSKLFIADCSRQELVFIDLKKMSEHRVAAFGEVAFLRRLIGVQHKSHQSLLAITTDAGKKTGRLMLHDVKSGEEITFGSVGQAKSLLIAADHHIVLSTSSAYQNVIRVLEPFSLKLAA